MKFSAGYVGERVLDWFTYDQADSFRKYLGAFHLQNNEW